jgi:quinol monooxygenase YgiN
MRDQPPGSSSEEPNTMIHVVAVITAKPGMRDSILQAFRDNVPAVKAEQGCIEYGAAVDFEDGPKFQTRYGPDTLLVIEKWASMDALSAHAAAPHMAAYAARTKDMIVSRQIHILSPA